MNILCVKIIYITDFNMSVVFDTVIIVYICVFTTCFTFYYLYVEKLTDPWKIQCVPYLFHIELRHNIAYILIYMLYICVNMYIVTELYEE